MLCFNPLSPPHPKNQIHFAASVLTSSPTLECTILMRRFILFTEGTARLFCFSNTHLKASVFGFGTYMAGVGQYVSSDWV